MNKAVIEAGLSHRELNPDEISAYINSVVGELHEL
jgi:hypothetical protein